MFLIKEHLDEYLDEEDWNRIKKNISELEEKVQIESEYVISRIRHHMAFEIFENVADVGHLTKTDLRNKIDDFLMHPILGYAFMIGILYLIFSIIFPDWQHVRTYFS